MHRLVTPSIMNMAYSMYLGTMRGESLVQRQPLFCYEVNQTLSDSLQYLVVMQLFSMLKALIELPSCSK